MQSVGYIIMSDYSLTDPFADAAFSQGWSARQQGVPIRVNPFPIDSSLYSAWLDGWYKAEDLCKEAFAKNRQTFLQMEAN